METSLLYSLSGLVVGFLVGLTGVGGGSLMTPILVLLFGVHPVSAVATDLIYAAITKAAGTAAHHYSRAIDWRITGLLAAGSVPASLLTLVVVANSSRGDPAFSATIKFALGYALLITAVLILLRHQLIRLLSRPASAEGLAPTADQKAHSWQGPLTVITGIVLGTLVSLTSVGAGALGVTALLALYPRLSTHRIVATDIAHAVPLTLVSGIGYWFMGEVNFPMLGALLTGSIPGILIGSWLQPKTPDGLLRPILALILAIVGLRLVWQ